MYEEDKKRREEIEMINRANTLVYVTEKSLKDYGDKISADDKAHIEKELDAVKEAVKGKDPTKINPAMDALQKASHKLAEEVYKNTAGQAAQGAGSGSAQGGPSHQGASGEPASGGTDKKDGDILDADFKAEDEK
jgi:molecular chaperone DnaK